MAMAMALEMAMEVSSGSLWLFMTWLRLVLVDGVVMFFSVCAISWALFRTKFEQDSGDLEKTRSP